MALILVITIIQFFGVEVDGGSIEWLAALHLESETGSIGLVPPAHIALGSTLLWTDVWEVLVVGISAVDSDTHAVLTV